MALTPTPPSNSENITGGFLASPILQTIGLGLLGASGSNILQPLMLMKMLQEENKSTGMSTQNNINNMQAPEVPTINPLKSPYKVNDLNPRLQSALPLIMKELESKGWQPTISSGIRTPDEQAEKVRQGYSQTMNSKHLIGKAVDITDKRYGWDGPAADTNFQFWKDLGEAAKHQGMQWGGDWKNFKDVAHIQTSLNTRPYVIPVQTYNPAIKEPPQIPQEVYEEFIRLLDKGRDYGKNTITQNPYNQLNFNDRYYV